MKILKSTNQKNLKNNECTEAKYAVSTGVCQHLQILTNVKNLHKRTKNKNSWEFDCDQGTVPCYSWALGDTVIYCFDTEKEAIDFIEQEKLKSKKKEEEVVDTENEQISNEQPLETEEVPPEEGSKYNDLLGGLVGCMSDYGGMSLEFPNDDLEKKYENGSLSESEAEEIFYYNDGDEDGINEYLNSEE